MQSLMTNYHGQFWRHDSCFGYSGDLWESVTRAPAFQGTLLRRLRRNRRGDAPWSLNEHSGKYGGTMNRALTKADIVEAIYEKTDRNRADVKNTVEVLLSLMKQSIKKDNSLLVSGFGKFEAYDKEARKGRNPQTDETITLPPRKVVVFRLSRKFRAELNGEEAED